MPYSVSFRRPDRHRSMRASTKMVEVAMAAGNPRLPHGVVHCKVDTLHGHLE